MSELVHQSNSGEVAITIEEYEHFMGCQRWVKAIQDTMTEYHLKRKLLDGNTSHDEVVALRRITLNRISVISDRGWNG